MSNIFRALIIEDEKNNAELLNHFLNNYCPMVVVDGIAKNVKEAKLLIKQKRPQLVFLDIMLGNQDAFELLSKLEEINFQIIFTTAYEEYAIRAFKFNAIDYLLKPIDIQELKKAVQKAIKNIKNENFQNYLIKDFIIKAKNDIITDKTLVVSSHKEIKLFRESEIIYLESSGRYTIFYLVSGEDYVSTKNLGEYEKILNPNTFCRIHNSYVINLNHLSKIDKVNGDQCILSNNKLLPLAKRRKEILFDLLKRI